MGDEMRPPSAVSPEQHHAPSGATNSGHFFSSRVELPGRIKVKTWGSRSDLDGKGPSPFAGGAGLLLIPRCRTMLAISLR
jgi:hypothetical protein